MSDARVRPVVRRGAALSLQMHYPGAEHRVVVRGTSTLTRGGQTILRGENESTDIYPGVTRRLASPGRVVLETIEMQSGRSLGDDDVVRFEDNCGRKQ